MPSRPLGPGPNVVSMLVGWLVGGSDQSIRTIVRIDSQTNRTIRESNAQVFATHIHKLAYLYLICLHFFKEYSFTLVLELCQDKVDWKRKEFDMPLIEWACKRVPTDSFKLVKANKNIRFGVGKLLASSNIFTNLSLCTSVRPC